MSPADKGDGRLTQLAVDMARPLRGPAEVDVVLVVIEKATGNTGWAATTRDRGRIGLALKAVAYSIMD